MAYEILDYLFLFWLLLTGAIYVLGNIYDQSLKAKQKSNEDKRRQRERGWSASRPEVVDTASSWIGSNYVNSTTSEARYNYGNNENSISRAANFLPSSSSTLSYAQPGSFSNTGGIAIADLETSGGLGSPASAGEHKIPIASGYNSDCVEWVNKILYLFYTNKQKYGPIICEAISRSLNEKLSNITSSSSDLSHLTVEFGIINQSASWAPELANVRTETESDRSVSAICKVYLRRLSLELSVRKHRGFASGSYDAISWPSGTKDDSHEFELILENLEGKLKSMAVLSDKLIVFQFMERPDTKMALRPRGEPISGKPLISEQTLVGLILQAIGQTVVDLYFGEDADFPSFRSSQSGYKSRLGRQLREGASELKRHIKQDFLGALSGQKKQRRLLVKLVSARNINYNQEVSCVMALDTPTQRQVSSRLARESNPQWQEHFLFDITDESRELSLELWDSIGCVGVPGTVGVAGQGGQSGKFLGAAHVPLATLRQEPVQRLNLALGPQAGAVPSPVASGREALLSGEGSAQVGGELQLELMYLEHAAPAEATAASGDKRPAGELVSVDRKLTPAGYVITTTTITRRPPSHSGRQSRPTRRSEQPKREEPKRARSRSRSLLRAIRRTLSFSGGRSSSLGGVTGADSPTPSRPDSAMFEGNSSGSWTPGGLGASLADADDRSSLASSNSRARSVPAGCSTAPAGELPRIVINRSGGVAAQPAFSFEPPKSQLVLECLERRRSSAGPEGGVPGAGRLRHYAVSEAQLARWPRPTATEKRVKLHLFNEHLFVACHLSASSGCHLCGRQFARRPGKQGYKCRQCHLLAHKQCHVLVDHNCPYALPGGLKLVMVEPDQVAPPTPASDSTPSASKKAVPHDR